MPVQDRKAWELKKHGTHCRQCGQLDRYVCGACRPCSIEKTRRARRKNPNWRKYQGVQARYGITKEFKERFYLQLNGMCSFCRSPMAPVWHRDCQVEHNHDTGRIRGLVHPKCNRLIGVLDRLRKDAEIRKCCKEYFRDSE